MKHEILSANKYENANNELEFSYLLADKFSFSAMFIKKECAIINNLRFINRTSFMLSLDEHKTRFKTPGPCLKVYSPVSNGISLERMYSPRSHFEKCFVYQKKRKLAFSYLLADKFSCPAM